MTPPEDDDLDPLLRTPLLEPPEDFVHRVMSALPERPASIASADAAPPKPGWLPMAVAALCGAIGALGAVEVALFVGGLWLGAPAAFG